MQIGFMLDWLLTLCISFIFKSSAKCWPILIEFGQGVEVWRILFSGNLCQKKRDLWEYGPHGRTALGPYSFHLCYPRSCSRNKDMWWEYCWAASILQVWWLERVKHIGYKPTENYSSEFCCSENKAVAGRAGLQLDFSITLVGMCCVTSGQGPFAYSTLRRAVLLIVSLLRMALLQASG